MYRMVVAAQMVSELVLVALERAKIPPSMIHENKYFVGGSIDQAKRLTDKGRLAVIAMVESEMDQGKAVHVEAFKQEYCLPVRHAEVWVQSKVKKYGQLTEMPSFRRMEQWLMSSAARIPVLTQVLAGRKLEGTGAPETGIEQCRTAVQELEKALAAATKPSSAQGQSAASTDALDGAELANAQDGDRSTPAKDEGSAECTYMEDVPEEEDPVRVVAKSKTDIELSQIAYYREWQELHKDLLAAVLPQQRLVALVAAPTSKPKIVLKNIDQAVSLFTSLSTKRVKLVVPVGKRLDLAAAVQTKLTTSLPQMDSYVVQLTHGTTQKAKKLPQYLVYAQAKTEEFDVPVTLAALSARARPGEGTRLRCLDANCPWRPKEELDALLSQGNGSTDTLEATCEMNEDDMDCLVQDDLEDVGEDHDEGMLIEPVLPPSSGGKRLATDLWPFAFSAEFYQMIFNTMSPSAAPHHIVIATVSAFPGPVLAARELKACWG